MYYLNKNDQFYYLKNGYMTTMMPDICTLNTRIAQKRIKKNPYFHCNCALK